MPSIINANAFGVIGDDSRDNQAALANLIAKESSLYFPDGIYRHSGTINWSKANICVATESPSGVIFKHTGTGIAHTLDGGTVTIPSTSKGRLGPFTIQGNAGSTDAFYVCNWHGWEIDIIAKGITGLAFKSQFAIGGILRCQVNDGATVGGGIQLGGNTRNFDAYISNGSGSAGTILTVLSLGTDSASIAVGMTVTGVGVTAGTVVTAFLSGTGGAGTYSVNHSQLTGGTGETMGDNGVTGPSNSIRVVKPVCIGTGGFGIEMRQSDACTIESADCESNASTYDVVLRGNATSIKVDTVYSNNNVIDQGIANVWINPTVSGTLFWQGALWSKVVGGRVAILNIDSASVGVDVDDLAYDTSVTDVGTGTKLNVGKVDGTFPVGRSIPQPYFQCARHIGQFDSAEQELTASGAFSANTTALQLNHATVDIVATWPTAPVAGRIASIIDTSASGTAAHSVKLASGVTFDGTNNTVTLNAPDEAVFLIGSSATRWRVMGSVGTPSYSIT